MSENFLSFNDIRSNIINAPLVLKFSFNNEKHIYIVLLRFVEKSPTSSLEVDIDVGRPNIDVEHCRKIQKNSGTTWSTETADHFF